MSAPVLLETQGLTKTFGGLVAVDSVSIQVREKQAHAVIGPNGAGKSTLVNLITGHLPPSSGSVMFGGRDITGMEAHRVARLGLGRSYQKTNLFASLTVIENVRLAAQVRLGSAMRFWSPASALSSVNEDARRALDQCGLSARADRIAGEMSHGEQRQLELAMVLAAGPKVLVLDEPLAGMGSEESERMVELLRRLGRDYTLVLVEHDMDAVFSVAEILTVMVNGAVLESGPVAMVRASRAVQDAYLGDGTEEY